MAVMSPIAGGGVAPNTQHRPSPPQHRHPQTHPHHQLDQAHRGLQHHHQQQPEAHRLQHYRSLPGPSELSPVDPGGDGGGLHLPQAPGSPNFASSRSLPGLHDFSDVRHPLLPAVANGRPCRVHLGNLGRGAIAGHSFLGNQACRVSLKTCRRVCALRGRQVAIRGRPGQGLTCSHIQHVHVQCGLEALACAKLQDVHHPIMADLHDFAQHVGLQSMDMTSPALPMPQLNRASRSPHRSHTDLLEA